MNKGFLKKNLDFRMIILIWEFKKRLGKRKFYLKVMEEIYGRYRFFGEEVFGYLFRV